MKKHRKKAWKFRLLNLILLVICLYSAVRLVQYGIGSVSARRTNAELQAMYGGEEENLPSQVPAAESTSLPSPAPEPGLLECYQYIGDSVLPAAEKMLAVNPDTVAWLRIPDGIVDLPVVFRDNTYYLDRDFYGRKSENGTLFLDGQHPFKADTQYLVIHGHDMYDGSMFGKLSHYRMHGFLEKHPTVYLNTLYRQEEYEAIGVLFVPSDIRSEGYVPYVGMRKFKSPEQFYGFADLIRENALHWKEGAELLPTDALLALSTCFDDNRIVVICRRTGMQ